MNSPFSKRSKRLVSHLLARVVLIYLHDIRKDKQKRSLGSLKKDPFKGASLYFY